MAASRSNLSDVEVEKPVVEEENGPWARCPLDVLMIIFANLEPVDLMSCIHVNTIWRDAVNYLGLHKELWPQLAQTEMVNKGIDLRRRADPKLRWNDIYINYRLWHCAQHATLTWNHEFTDRDIRFLHVYKDILIVETDEDYFKKYYHIEERLKNVTKELVDANEAELDEVEQIIDGYGRANNGHPPNNGDGEPNGVGHPNDENDLSPDSPDNTISEDKERPSYVSDKMIKMLVQEAPFTRLLVVDEECYYMLNDKNILRYVKWDENNKRWLTFVLARYYACNMHIADISVYNDDVYMMLRTGLVFKLDRTGRNFLPDRRFNRYMTPAQFEVSRMIYGELDPRIQTAGSLKIPDYGTSKHLLFSNKISVLVSVPCDKEFQIKKEESGNIIEYPCLTCATQHGEVLFLGFMDGRVEIWISKNIIKNEGKCEISANVKDCPEFSRLRGENPAVIALEVHETLQSHHIFVASHSNVYRLVVTYPQSVKDRIGLITND